MKNVVTGPSTSDVQAPMKVASDGYMNGKDVYPGNIPVEHYVEINGIERVDPLSR